MCNTKGESVKFICKNDCGWTDVNPLLEIDEIRDGQRVFKKLVSVSCPDCEAPALPTLPN
jgi:hypothetical protein